MSTPDQAYADKTLEYVPLPTDDIHIKMIIKPRPNQCNDCQTSSCSILPICAIVLLGGLTLLVFLLIDRLIGGSNTTYNGEE